MSPEGRPDAGAAAPGAGGGWRGLRNRLAASPGLQRRAARLPLFGRLLRAEGEALFDIVEGFVHSQVLVALVELDLPVRLRDAPATTAALAASAGIAPPRMEALLRAAAALGLVARRGAGWQATARGAAVAGVPGLAGMIRHHAAFYRDLADPLRLLRGAGNTELACLWPYVGGGAGGVGSGAAERYSQLMAASLAPLAEDTLPELPAGVGHLMDVGGGTGAFLAAVAAARPGLRLTLLDLPDVVAAARPLLAEQGLERRIETIPASFRDAALPRGADAISLVRVLFDHSDATVAGLLGRVHAALPPGGVVVVSEPMSGGARPRRPADTYFSFYCMAMGTGQVRSQGEIAAALTAAGFVAIRCPRPRRPFVTSVVTARRPGSSTDSTSLLSL